MPDVLLQPNDSILRHRLESFADRLRGKGYDVQLTRPIEHRGGSDVEITTELVIGLSLVIINNEYSQIKQWLKDWFTEQPRPRGPRRRLRVRVEDEHHHLFDQFDLGDEESVPEREEEETKTSDKADA